MLIHFKLGATLLYTFLFYLSSFLLHVATNAAPDVRSGTNAHVTRRKESPSHPNTPSQALELKDSLMHSLFNRQQKIECLVDLPS
jgi:hypothetical protein